MSKGKFKLTVTEFKKVYETQKSYFNELTKNKKHTLDLLRPVYSQTVLAMIVELQEIKDFVEAYLMSTQTETPTIILNLEEEISDFIHFLMQSIYLKFKIISLRLAGKNIDIKTKKEKTKTQRNKQKEIWDELETRFFITLRNKLNTTSYCEFHVKEKNSYSLSNLKHTNPAFSPALINFHLISYPLQIIYDNFLDVEWKYWKNYEKEDTKEQLLEYYNKYLTCYTENNPDNTWDRFSSGVLTLLHNTLELLSNSPLSILYNSKEPFFDLYNNKHKTVELRLKTNIDKLL